jgi:hypothetical protein
MGRKTLKDEATQARVINYAWVELERILNSKTVPDKSKREIVVKLCEKTIPKEIKLENVQNTINELHLVALMDFAKHAQQEEDSQKVIDERYTNSTLQ